MLLNKTLRSSTFRLAQLYVGLFGAAVFALFAYVYWSTAGYIKSRTDMMIGAEQRLLVDAYDRGGRDGLARLLAEHQTLPTVGDVYSLADASYAPLAGNLDGWPTAAREADGWVEFAGPGAPSQAKRPLLRAIVATLPDGAHLLVGKDIDDRDEFAGAINTGLALGVALLCVLAAAAGISVTRRTVARIEAINATSRDIMTGGLGKRIPLRGTRDEWDQLAANLNSMLARIEELVRSIKQVSDNVAHDLRTPLTRLRGRLEAALTQPMSADDHQALIGRTVAELDDVLKTFASLLRISAVEARERTVGFQAVDLAGLAAEVADLYDPAAEDRGAHVRVEGAHEARIAGDRDLLFEALSNLLDNAIKHGAGDVEVSVRVAAGGDAVVLAVADHGPGIPADQRARVFERFYRLERSRTTPGNGLGLSLVAAVAQFHNARIALGGDGRGLRVELTFAALAKNAEARAPAAAAERPAPGSASGAAGTARA